MNNTNPAAAPDATAPSAGASNTSPAPDQAKVGATDKEIAQQVKKAVTQDTTLAGASQSVKVTAQNGKVTLAGKVKSEAEKAAVEQKAIEIVGRENVTNKIMVKGS